MDSIKTDNLQVDKIVRAFADELVKQLGGQIYEIIWYGSTARGEATDDSDIDVAIIAEREDFAFRKKVGSISSSFSLEFDTSVDPRVIAYAKYHGEWGRLSLLVDEIVKDGKTVWTRSTN